MDNNFWIMQKYGSDDVGLTTKLKHMEQHGLDGDTLKLLAEHPEYADGAPNFGGSLEKAAEWAHTKEHEGPPRVTGIGPAFEDHPDPDLRVSPGKGHGGMPNYLPHDEDDWATDITNSQGFTFPARPFRPGEDDD